MKKCAVAATKGTLGAERPRYTHVDLLRGLAAIAVLFFHYRMFYPDGNVLGPQTFHPERQPLFRLLWPLYEQGNLAVQLFWALSGFVFMATYSSDERTINPARFVVWRFSRLYPLHIATLIYVAGIQAVSFRSTGSYSVVPINDIYHFGLQLLMASNWGFETGNSFNAPIWSVSVEVLIYMTFVMFMGSGRTGVVPTAVMIGLFALLSALFTNPVATCGFMFFLGVMTFHASGLLGRLGRVVAGAAVTSGLVVTTLLATMLFKTEHAGGAQVVMFMCLPMLLLTAATIDLGMKPVPQRWRWVGQITYAIYLIHMPIIITVVLLRRFGGTHYQTPDQLWFLLLYLTSVISCGAFIFRSFEMPAQNFIRRKWLRCDQRSLARGPQTSRLR